MDRDLSLFTKLTSEDISRRDFLKRTGYSGLTALSAGSLLAACGGSATTSQSSGPAPKGTKVSGPLTLVYLGTAADQKVWNALFDLFRKKYPDVNLKAKGIPLDNWAAFFDTVSTQIAGGQNYDVIQVATEGQRLFASRGLVEPVDAYLERDKDELAEFFSDIHPNLIKWNKDNSPDGKTYYLPGEFNTMCMWYNADMFKQAGVAEPTDDWKWDDFLTTAQKLTKPGKVFGMNVPAAYFAGIMPWLLTNGASTLDPTWKKSIVNSAAAIEATKFMVSLVAQKISPPPGGTFDQFTASAQGKLAMFGGGRWPIISLRALNAVDKMKIVAWPQKTQKGSPVGWNGYPIMKASQNKEAAWAFVKFITSKEASVFFEQNGGTVVPPRKSVASSPAFLANAPAGSDKLYAALDYSTPIPSPDKGNIVQKDIEDTWSQMLAGNVSVEQGLAQLDQKIKANL